MAPSVHRTDGRRIPGSALSRSASKLPRSLPLPITIPAEDRPYALSLADYWNERLEDWTYVESGAFIEEFGVEGYYVRVAPAMSEGGLCGRVEVRNRGGERVPAVTLIGMEYLYLPRLGLRDPRDPRIQNTLKISESILKVETPHGIAYHRYNGDGYGEHEDGRPFDGTGVGRAWPLLTGERGYLDVLLGIDPLPYLEMMTRMTGPGGLIPEQVWDGPPLLERGLKPGMPSGSAMPPSLGACRISEPGGSTAQRTPAEAARVR